MRPIRCAFQKARRPTKFATMKFFALFIIAGVVLHFLVEVVGKVTSDEEVQATLCDRPVFPVNAFVKHGKQSKRVRRGLDCRVNENRTYNCMEKRLDECDLRPGWKMMWSNTSASCPISTSMTTYVALNAANPTGPLLLTLQSSLSDAKEASYHSTTNEPKLLHASRWTSSSVGTSSYSSGVAYVGHLAVMGYFHESYVRDAFVNGTEADKPDDVGAALLHTGVVVGGDGIVHVAAQSVLAHPSSRSGNQFGHAVAIIELARDALYHVAIGTAMNAIVHMYAVTAGGGGWGAPSVTQLSNLTAPWDWGSSISSLAARPAVPTRPPLLLVGTWTDDVCGVTAEWAASCPSSGSVHAFTLNGTGAWVWNGTLKAPVTKPSYCGTSVAVVGALAAVGCFADKSNSTAVNVGETWGGTQSVGSAHVWRLDSANASKSVREAYLKAFRANAPPQFGRAVAVAVNRTHEVIAVSAPFSTTGAPYGTATSLAMPYDVPVTDSVGAEGEVWTFVNVVGGVTWQVALRIKAPMSMPGARFGWVLTAAVTPAGQVMLGIGTWAGCKGYLVVLA